MKRLVFCLVVLFAVSGIFGPAKAALVSVSGPASSAGTLPAIIAPPFHVLDNIVTNTGMQGFDEAQAVVTTVAHATDSGVIPAGTLVDSHMIFLNSQGIDWLSHEEVEWTFSGKIIGVMSDFDGNLESVSTSELGNPATNYTVTFPGSGPAAPYPARGMEISDSYVVAGNTITVTMVVTEPDDWIRVITVPALNVLIDIKPGSCPNPLNPKSQGSVPVAIVGTPDFDPVAMVDPSSVTLEGVSMNGVVEIVDSTMPYESDPKAPECKDCLEAEPHFAGDGYDDLVVKFDTQALAEAIAVMGGADSDACIELSLEGATYDGIPILGSDIMLVRKGIAASPASGAHNPTTTWSSIKSR